MFGRRLVALVCVRCVTGARTKGRKGSRFAECCSTGGGRQIARAVEAGRGGTGAQVFGRGDECKEMSHHQGIRDDHLRLVVYCVLRTSAETVTVVVVAPKGSGQLLGVAV